MISYRPAVAAAACLMIQLTLSANAAQFTFQVLGDMPGGPFGSGAKGISADGSFVVAGKVFVGYSKYPETC